MDLPENRVFPEQDVNGQQLLAQNHIFEKYVLLLYVLNVRRFFNANLLLFLERHINLHLERSGIVA